MTAAPVPDLRHRATALEWMDDPAINDARLSSALDELRLVSRWLGGASVSLDALEPVVPPATPSRVLDVGTGGADFPAAVVRWAEKHGRDVQVEGVDLNPVTLALADAWLDRRLTADQRACITLTPGDAYALPFDDQHFDVAHAALFLHHFEDADAVRVLAEMGRVARVVVINDLHRHWAAYAGIRALAFASRSAMFRHDGPLSVRRGFRRAELAALAAAAGLDGVITWHWAFRWRFVGTRAVPPEGGA